jgi:hypothetical protein
MGIISFRITHDIADKWDSFLTRNLLSLVHRKLLGNRRYYSQNMFERLLLMEIISLP